MKFLLIVLAIHLTAELIAKNSNNKNGGDEGGSNAPHPAEYELR